MHRADSSRRSPAGEQPSVRHGRVPAAATRRRTRALVAVVVLAIAALVRVGPYERFFTPTGVLLAADGDTYYHALRAERIARQWPRADWVDPGMNHPYGADIPWPPLLDEIVATVSVASGPPAADHVAGVAAALPPLFGVALVVLTAALGAALLGGRWWWDAALVAALLPAAVRLGFVGRADHHVLEVLIFAGALLAYAKELLRERPGWLRPAILGAALALSFWNWAGSALYLLVLAAHVAVLHVAAPAGDRGPGRAARALALGGGIAAAVLAVTIAAFGPPGALTSARLTPITALAVVMCALVAAGAGVVLLFRRVDPRAGPLRRAGHLAAAVVLPLSAVLAVPSALRSGLVHGVTALTASTAWYATISEFWPLVGSGRQPWTTEALLAIVNFGVAPVAFLAAARPFSGAWRREPGRRPTLALFAVWALTAILLAIVRRRFEGYASVPLALGAAWGVRSLIAPLAPLLGKVRWAPAAASAAALLLVAAPGFPVTLTGDVAELPAGAQDKFPLLAALRDVPARQGREAVLAPWSEGHEIQWLARKPVVATPFGTDIDPRSLQDEAAFFTARSPEYAASILRRRRVGFLLVANPVREVATMAPFAPGSPEWAVEERGLSTGSRYAIRPELFDLVVSRLFFFDGLSHDGAAPALAEYRLLDESRTTDDVLGFRAQAYKLFGVVEGATLRVRGASPGAEVSASARIVSAIGRPLAWTTRAPVGQDGTAALRVPYASGPNGGTRATAYAVTDGVATRLVPVTEEQVTAGGAVDVDLSAR